MAEELYRLRYRNEQLQGECAFYRNWIDTMGILAEQMKAVLSGTPNPNNGIETVIGQLQYALDEQSRVEPSRLDIQKVFLEVLGKSPDPVYSVDLRRKVQERVALSTITTAEYLKEPLADGRVITEGKLRFTTYQLKLKTSEAELAPSAGAPDFVPHT